MGKNKGPYIAYRNCQQAGVGKCKGLTPQCKQGVYVPPEKRRERIRDPIQGLGLIKHLLRDAR